MAASPDALSSTSAQRSSTALLVSARAVTGRRLEDEAFAPSEWSLCLMAAYPAIGKP